MYIEDSKEMFIRELYGVVDEEVTGFPGGRLRFQGSYWPCILDEDCGSFTALKPGDRATVIGRIGICLIVRPL